MHECTQLPARTAVVMMLCYDERLIPRLQSIVAAAVLAVFCVRFAVGLLPPAPLDDRDRPCRNAMVHRSELVRYPRFAWHTYNSGYNT